MGGRFLAVSLVGISMRSNVTLQTLQRLLLLLGFSTSSIAATSMSYEIVRSLLALAIVIGAMIATLYVVKKFKQFPSKSRLLKLEESLSVGPRESICVVDVEGRRFAIGVTNVQITLLAELAPVASVTTPNEEMP
jgi:flagellar biosynthetic protein FliO